MGQIEVTRRRGRRRKKLLDDLKDRRGYHELKEEALDRTMWKNHFGRGFGPVVSQITDDDDDPQHVFLLGKYEGKRLLERPWHRWEENITLQRIQSTLYL